MVMAMDSKQACTSWLSIFGTGAWVKKKVFVIIVYEIRVNQVQGQGQAVEEIYKQNPRLCKPVEILQVVFVKKLL
jgi:hypothetical protein